MKRRDDTTYGRIISDPDIQGGEPCIAGTRIQALLVAGKPGMTGAEYLAHVEHMLTAYSSSLTPVDILGAVAFGEGFAYAQMLGRRKKIRKARRLVALAQEQMP